MNRITYSFALIIVLALARCGSTDSDSGVSGGSKSSSSTYKYEFSENGCNTGKQEFSSLEALCDGLKNDSLNKGCAESLRKKHFESSGCSGSF